MTKIAIWFNRLLDRLIPVQSKPRLPKADGPHEEQRKDFYDALYEPGHKGSWTKIK